MTDRDPLHAVKTLIDRARTPAFMTRLRRRVEKDKPILDRLADTEHRRGVTTDRNDPALREIGPDGMQRTYLVLSDDERARGFVRPVRHKYLHTRCGVVTTMGKPIAETYARDPSFYGGTYCAGCREHFPVGADGEFVWDDGSGQKVGT